MSPLTQEIFKAYAHAENPKEACGFILGIDGREEFFPVPNSHSDPERFFTIRPEHWVAATAKGKLLSIVHSHTKGDARSSTADKVMCESSRLPWHIYSTLYDQWSYLQPSGFKPPLLEREFIFGVLDCYTLIRDYFAERHQITIKDYYRDDPEFYKKGINPYEDNFRAEGFVEVRDGLKVSDCFLIQIRSDLPNHAAIWVGNDLILHHLSGRLSNMQPYGGSYLKNTYKTLRHKSLV